VKTPETLKLTPEQTDDLFAQVRSCNLSDQYKDWIISGLQSLFWIAAAYQDKKHKLFRFMSKIFGSKTERIKKRKKLNYQKTASATANEKANPSPVQNENAKEGEQLPTDPTSNEKEKPKGHGHRSANAFQKAACVKIAHESLKAGDKCSECLRGRLYRYPPGKILCLTGHPPISAIRLNVEALRCNACGTIFRAKLPKIIATQSRATAEAKAAAAILKYKGGVPFYRLDMLQKIFGTRVSKSELWEMVEDVAESAIPIYSQLCKETAKAQVLIVDDTNMRILEFMKENEIKKRLKELENSTKAKKSKKDADRTGIFTTAILTEGLEHNITAYFTGRRHAGENLDKLLHERPEELSVVIEACDALTRNNPKNHEVLKAYCNAHNRRNFYDLLGLWPKEAVRVLELYASIFYNEKVSLEKKMSWEDRQKYHQEESGPIMEEIKRFCNALLESKTIEPNDLFGKSIAYQNKHWEGLTLFLRVPGAPLTTNSVERALKAAIRNRKNSLFYKTEWGALVGDIHHTIIETCTRNDVDPMDYLVACQICSNEVRTSPHLWLPWNFAKNFSYIAAKSKRDAALNDLHTLVYREKVACC
jgi:transposase